ATRNNLPRDEQRTAPLTVDRRWFEGQRARCLTYAQKAVSLSSGLPAWEQNWISGSFYSLSEDASSAVPFYERLHSLKPRHEYGASNLLFAYRALGRFTDALRVSRELADANPNNIFLTSDYIENAVTMTGELAGVEPYVARLK